MKTQQNLNILNLSLDKTQHKQKINIKISNDLHQIKQQYANISTFIYRQLKHLNTFNTTIITNFHKRVLGIIEQQRKEVIYFKKLTQQTKKQVILLKTMIDGVVKEYNREIEDKDITINLLKKQLNHENIQENKERDIQSLSQQRLVFTTEKRLQIIQQIDDQQLTSHPLTPIEETRQISERLQKLINLQERQCSIQQFNLSHQQIKQKQINGSKCTISQNQISMMQSHDRSISSQISIAWCKKSFNSEQNRSKQYQQGSIFTQIQGNNLEDSKEDFINDKPSTIINMNNHIDKNLSFDKHKRHVSQLLTIHQSNSNIEKASVFNRAAHQPYFNRKNHHLNEMSNQKSNQKIKQFYKTKQRISNSIQKSKQKSHGRSYTLNIKDSRPNFIQTNIQLASNSKQKNNNRTLETIQPFKQKQFIENVNNHTTHLKSLSNLYQKNNLKKKIKQLQQQLKITLKQFSKYIWKGYKDKEYKYEGQHRNGKREGKGKITYIDGKVYEGQFRKGKKCGKGEVTMDGIKILVGQFINQQLYGECSILSMKHYMQKNFSNKQNINTNGQSVVSLQMLRQSSYIGNFKQNNFHGLGTLHLNPYQKIVLKFHEGKPIGQLTYYYQNQIDTAYW